MTRQYVAIEFYPGARSFTYHNDGDPVEIDDEVLVPDRRGGSKRVKVVWITGVMPHGFETKAILGLAPPREDATA